MPSHGAQFSPRHLPHISVDPGEPLDPGLKQEISQQVRELRAQKRSQRGCSPGHIQNNDQAASKAANKTPAEQPSQGPVSQSNMLPKQYPQGACDGKERPRGRFLSPNQAAIQVVKSAEPKVKGQVQKPQSGPNPASNPAIKRVSACHRSRSHSPRCRIEVDVVEPECQGGWRKGMRAVSSQECLVVPSHWGATSPDPDDLLSKSFPPPVFIQRRSWAPACSSAGFLQVPSNRQCSFSSPSLLSTSPANSAPCCDAVRHLSPLSSDDACSSVRSSSPHFSDDAFSPFTRVPHQVFVPILISPLLHV